LPVCQECHEILDKNLLGLIEQGTVQFRKPKHYDHECIKLELFTSKLMQDQEGLMKKLQGQEKKAKAAYEYFDGLNKLFVD
jgi:hypothetical protein